ncbi:MAG: PocR ligand-binding domain-containing protein, partial [Euryarchaeota archaeon]|nr:PocR ligand-binding domain-containing protein [Euryarchaeota archaeon]
MSGSPPSLRELVDIDELQSIQDSFARAVGISSVILSPECEPLTRFTNPTGFCALIQSTEKGKERCFRSFMEMGKNALESEKPKIFYCFAHGGHFVAPIMIDGEYKGTMFAGQFTPEKFSSEQLHDLEEIAQEIDIDPWLLVKEAEKMRVVGEDVIRNYSSLLFKIVETIARRGAQAAELERRVQERTGELAEANKELVQEVTERKLAEDALQKTNKNLELEVSKRKRVAENLGKKQNAEAAYTDILTVTSRTIDLNTIVTEGLSNLMKYTYSPLGVIYLCD